MSYELAYPSTKQELDDLELSEKTRELRHLLENHICEVTFTKVDGAERVMPCTLMSRAIPGIETDEKTRTRKINIHNLSVWSVEQSAWRSFRIASVSKIQIIE